MPRRIGSRSWLRSSSAPDPTPWTWSGYLLPCLGRHTGHERLHRLVGGHEALGLLEEAGKRLPPVNGSRDWIHPLRGTVAGLAEGPGRGKAHDDDRAEYARRFEGLRI